MDPTGSAVGLDDVRRWGQQLDDVARRIGARFSRSEARTRVGSYLAGLLGPVQRKNAWQLAERIGDADPYGVQYLIGRADWDADLVRDDLRAYVVETLGDPDAVLVLDEAGFLKKGDKSAGTARQYTGTAGRIENAQVGVFLADASAHGTALIDRALYLPKEWTDDPKRCTAAGIPEDTAFTTKIQLAKAMLGRAFQAGVPVGWVTGDEVYGAWELRRWLEEQGRRYVLAVRANQYVWAGPRQATVAALAKGLPKRDWHRITIASGSKGPRRYAWAWLVINSDLGPTWRRWLLVRRSLDNREELACYVATGPARTPLNRLAKVAGARWAFEGAFESAKQEVGLADYEARSWAGWHRHITLSMLALAVLAAVRVLAEGSTKKLGRQSLLDRWLAIGSPHGSPRSRPMAKPRRIPRTASTRTVELMTATRVCPECDLPLWAAYKGHRVVATLDGLTRFAVQVRRCRNADCPRHNRSLRAEAEGAIALPQQEFGLDVISLIGRLRHADHRSVAEIHAELTRRGLSICVRSVACLLDRYDELLALSLSDPSRLRRVTSEAGRVILAIDGLQPDVGHEVLWVIRDVLSG